VTHVSFFCRKYEKEFLILLRPNDEPYRLPIRQSELCSGGIELTACWNFFCLDNEFVDGDVLEFAFRNIKNSGWVDVKKVYS